MIHRSLLISASIIFFLFFSTAQALDDNNCLKAAQKLTANKTYAGKLGAAMIDWPNRPWAHLNINGVGKHHPLIYLNSLDRETIVGIYGGNLTIKSCTVTANGYVLTGASNSITRVTIIIPNTAGKSAVHSIYVKVHMALGIEPDAATGYLSPM